MSDANITLALLTEGWQAYQGELSNVLALLSQEQLALRTAPHLRSIEELARHIIAVRAGWFHFQLGQGDEAFSEIAAWMEPGYPTRSASELVNGLAVTWQVMQEALARYTPTNLQEIVYDEDEEGNKIPLTRGWVVWHVMQHDLYHGGEMGYTLGMHGLQAPNINL